MKPENGEAAVHLRTSLVYRFMGSTHTLPRFYLCIGLESVFLTFLSLCHIGVFLPLYHLGVSYPPPPVYLAFHPILYIISSRSVLPLCHVDGTVSTFVQLHCFCGQNKLTCDLCRLTTSPQSFHLAFYPIYYVSFSPLSLGVI